MIFILNLWRYKINNNRLALSPWMADTGTCIVRTLTLPSPDSVGSVICIGTCRSRRAAGAATTCCTGIVTCCCCCCCCWIGIPTAGFGCTLRIVCCGWRGGGWDCGCCGCDCDCRGGGCTTVDAADAAAAAACWACCCANWLAAFEAEWGVIGISNYKEMMRATRNVSEPRQSSRQIFKKS